MAVTVDEIIKLRARDRERCFQEAIMSELRGMSNEIDLKMAEEHQQEIEYLEDYKRIKKWKSEVMEDFCKYDCNSIEEVRLNAYMKALTDVEYMLNNIEINIDKDTVMDFYRKALDKLQMLGELKENK